MGLEVCAKHLVCVCVCAIVCLCVCAIVCVCVCVCGWVCLFARQSVWWCNSGHMSLQANSAGKKTEQHNTDQTTTRSCPGRHRPCPDYRTLWTKQDHRLVWCVWCGHLSVANHWSEAGSLSFKCVCVLILMWQRSFHFQLNRFKNVPKTVWDAAGCSAKSLLSTSMSNSVKYRASYRHQHRYLHIPS